VSDKLPQERRWQGFGEVVLAEARVVEKCAYCAFMVSALLEEARQTFEQDACRRPGRWHEPRRVYRGEAAAIGVPVPDS